MRIHHRSSRSGRATLLALAAVWSALAICAGCSLPVPPTPAPAQVTAVPTANATAVGSAGIDSGPAIAVYEQNSPKVVNINTLALIRTASGTAAVPQGVGSGFVYDTNADIVTNDHVLQDAAQLQVTFKDGTSSGAQLVGRDAYLDLAVIRVDNMPGVQPVTLGDSDALRIGQAAFAIGSPLGLQLTLTQGVVSAVRLPEQNSTSGAIDLPGGAVQTDASINPGNSGGPLFDAAGNVIGVNTAILTQSGGSQGLGFAIPINVVKRVVPELIQYGQYRHPQLGVVGIPLALIGHQIRQQLGIPADLQEGLLVVQVSGGAQAAGIQPSTTSIQGGGQPVPSGGDVVVGIDGRPVSTAGDIIAYIDNNKRPGDTVTVTLVRNGQRLDVPVVLGERAQS